MQTNPTSDPGIEFRRAAAEGNTDKVRNLLDKNYINRQSSNGNTALHWSIINQHYASTKLLLTSVDIDVDVQNKLGCTPLHLAAKQHDKKTVYRLLKAGAGHKNRFDKDGFSSLDYAMSGNCSFIVTSLKEKFPDLTFKDEDDVANRAFTAFKIENYHLLHNVKIFDPNYFFDEEVARYFLPGNRFKLSEIQTAIKKGQLNLHKLFCSGTLLQSAAVSRVEICEKFQWLLEQGVDTNLQASHEMNPCSYKNTALHTLIANEDEKNALKFIDQLITITHSKQKFNFNLTDSEGKTCLCLAVKVGQVDVVKKLIELKVDINLPDEDGNTPLHFAFLLGHNRIVNELLSKQANKNAKNLQQKKPYELLISTDIEDIRDCLEIIWINPDRKIKHSKKTYIELCMENREKIKTDYLNAFYETKISILPKRKSICFLLAAATGDLKSLQENCDDFTLNQTNAKGNTALHLACQHGHETIVKFLFQQAALDLHQENYEQLKAVELLSSLFLATLFEEKLLDTTSTTEETKETLSRLNKRKEVLFTETTPALKNY